jgi:hypothetical protein
MIGKFDIQVNLNGWVIPFHIESQGEGVFKVIYDKLTLGHLLVNDTSKWIYLNNIAEDKLLNPYSAAMISQAITNY